MKIIFLFISLFLTTQMLSAQSFRDVYSKNDNIEDRVKLVVGDAYNIRWVDDTTLTYCIRLSGGDETIYLLNSHSKDKKVITKEELASYERGNKTKRNISDTIISPDGKYSAYIKNANVWVKEKDQEETQLSYDAEFYDNQGKSKMYYSGLYWSPDSKKLVSMKIEDVKERQIPIVESSPKDQSQPKLTMYDYAKPGDKLPVTIPVLFDVEKKEIVHSDMSRYSVGQYFLQFNRWNKDSRSFIFEFNPRGHQYYQVVQVDAVTGNQKILIDEKSDTFIYYYNNCLFFTENEDIIWASQRDGWRHLYLVDSKTSAYKQLTKGDWVVRDLQLITKDFLLFTANGRNSISGEYNQNYYSKFPKVGDSEGGEDPYNIHLLKLDLKTMSITDLTPEYANHIITFNKDKSMFVDKFSRPEMPPVTLLRRISDGNVVAELGRADISALKKSGWTAPETFVAKGRDGKTDIWGTIFKPYNFNPKKKYPVIEYIYAGPHDSFAPKDFMAYDRYFKLNELGFIVVCIDGMGTKNRSKSFHDVCWRNLKDSGFPDRIKWIKEAASTRKYMDISKVGIYGYSAGGQSTLSALLNFGDFYKVGVALCGCHDNRMDKIWWNEQWMGYPIGKWYSENSNVDNAYKLNGELLIINGQMDTNVDPASSLQVIKELIKADKDFEQLYLPGYGHGLGDKYVTRRVFEFFWKRIIHRGE
jgi:dipeptidyl aminopeptidase/acylaminoacyl peptidase